MDFTDCTLCILVVIRYLPAILKYYMPLRVISLLQQVCLKLENWYSETSK